MTRDTSMGGRRVLDALLENQEAVFGVIDRAGERRHRVTQALLESVREGGHDWIEAGRRWSRRPLDGYAFLEEALKAYGWGQYRFAGISREALVDLTEENRKWTEFALRRLRARRERAQRAYAQTASSPSEFSHRREAKQQPTAHHGRDGVDARINAGRASRSRHPAHSRAKR